MILDKVENLNHYFTGEWVNKLLEFYGQLKNTTPDGIYSLIENEKLFCKLLSYETKTTDWITESHQEYIDFQILLEGEEIIEIYHPSSLEIKNQYSVETDCIFYDYPTIIPNAKINLAPQYVGVFFLQDAHTTQMAVNNQPAMLKKAVFKVHKSLLS